MGQYEHMSAEELRNARRLLDAEMERREHVAYASEIAAQAPNARDLEYVDYEWAQGYMGTLTDGTESLEVLRWLWTSTYIAHEAQYGPPPTVGHMGKVLCEGLASMVIGPPEDPADLRDGLGEQKPSFGGRGCLCTLEDTGGPESGPQLSVDIDEQCPRHAHLLDEVDEGPGIWYGPSTEDRPEWQVGDRVRLLHDVDRYPHFVAPAGALGTIRTYDSEICEVQLDEHLDGAEDWQNAVVWSLRDGDTPEGDIARLA